ncbi:MAG TPA: universal stress protein [Terracidiphilus sp.]|nr:universal stress protein [Terracidiphilus sp.]
MSAAMKPGWSRPSSILFASEIPANERAMAFAVAQAREFGAKLILFHAYDTMVVAASETSGVRYYDYAAAARAEREHLEPLAQRVRASGVPCEVVVRPGLAADQILKFLQEHSVDRIVMGTHCPGPIGKLLVGSVAEAVLRTAPAPVCVVGPDVADAAYRNYAVGTILCALSLLETSHVIARFAADVAQQHSARLVLQHVIRPQDRTAVLASRNIQQIEGDMLGLIPAEQREKLTIETVVVPGDPTEELLYQAGALRADLIVLGAHKASAFAAVARQGVVYKMMAHSQCPVMTLSPVVLAESGVVTGKEHPIEAYIAGVF